MDNNEVINKQSTTCSNVSRQIAFALGAVSWGLIYLKDSQSINIKWIPAICLILIIIYCTIDLLQYYITTLSTRKLEYQYQEAILNSKDEKTNQKIKTNHLIRQEKIEKRAFKLFTLKISVLPIVVILLLCYFIYLI